MAEDFDPLSYGSVVYNQLNQLMNYQELTNPQPVNQSVTNEDPPPENDYHSQTQLPTEDTLTNLENNMDVKPDINTQRKNGRLKYMSVKISQKDFKFYGCSLCNICYPTLPELDTHVASHNDRITSYDLKLKNQVKKKKLMKETKKHKKIKDIVKKEKELLDIEIKPEDGYIGTEKASEMNDCKENESGQEVNSTNCPADPNTLNAKKQELLNLQKIYKCFACYKQFSLSYYLKLHVRSHTDEKPYVCAECGQSFITASKLGRHNKRMHLAIKYQCRICYKFFCRFEFLTRHFDKKHAEDKLEGEPYDYNAILPYLKELEEQLKEKEEEKKKEKSPDIWGDLWSEPVEQPPREEVKQEEMKEAPIKIEIDCSEPISIEEVKLDPVDTVHIKLEPEECSREETDDCHNIYDDDDDEEKKNNTCKTEEPARTVHNDDDIKNEATSDEDYFPSNTWVSSPKDEPESTKSKSNLECPVCHKRVSSASYMRVHMRTHSGERPYRCPRCDQSFITASKMHRHALTHPETWDEDIKPDVKTEKEEGDKDKKMKMKKGLAKFLKKSKSGEKIKKGYQKRPYSCEFCHKRFLHLATLQIHKKSHEGEPLVYKCSFCLLEVADEAALRDHEPTHTGPKPYTCTVCGKCYSKRETMMYHRKSHAEHSPFICDVCTKGFSSAAKLQRHLAGHRTARFVLRYECPVCAHMFHTRYHVQLHLNTHQREGLIREQDRPHVLAMVLQNARRLPRAGDPAEPAPDERSRVCNICGEVFQHFYYLEEHLKSHGSRIAVAPPDPPEEKKHVCPVCSKSFKLHYYLKLHSFTHTKEKPFICQQCGKGFITRGKLKRHLETHSGLKKFQCHICCKFFTRTSYLRIHVRTIHGTQDYNFRLDGPSRDCQ